MSGRYAYSLDRETFLGQFETRADALRAAFNAARQQPEPPREVYVAQKIVGDAQTTGHAQEVIERMSDRAKAASESAAKYLHHVSEQEEADLDQALSGAIRDWLGKHNRLPDFFTIESISEHLVPPPAPPLQWRKEDPEVSEIGTSDLP